MGLPSTVLSLDCRVRVSLSPRPRTIVAVAFLPSCNTDLVLMTHLSPDLLQAPSPKPPVPSKIHDRTFFASGSQPIQCVASPTVTPLTVALNEAIRKFWLSVQDSDRC